MVAGINHTPDERFEPSSARSRMTRTGAVDQVAKNRRARGGAADFIQPLVGRCGPGEASQVAWLRSNGDPLAKQVAS